MKKICLLIVCLLIFSLFLSACQSISNSPIKYERRFGKYFESDSNSKSNQQGGTVDLSEGPKLRYDAKFGPKDLNFDIKIINPY